MGNQQNLGPRVAERVFEAVFPSSIIWFFSSSVGRAGLNTVLSQVQVLPEVLRFLNRYLKSKNNMGS